MNVTIEDISAVEKRLDVEIPFERVKLKLDEAYRDLGRKVSLKGFRKGKVPRNILEKMFGQSVKQEVSQKLMNEGFMQVATEQKLRPVADPVVESATYPEEPGHPFKFSARVEVASEVVPKDWKEVPLTKRKPKVDDHAIDHNLEHRREELAELKPIEGRDTTRACDVLTITVAGTVGELPVNRSDLKVDLSEGDEAYKSLHGHSSEPLPGIAKALTGIPLGAVEHPIVLELPEDAPQKELAGKRAELKITITEAKEKVLPALDDDFAKDTGEADTLAGLRDKVRAKLAEDDQKNIDRELRMALVKELLVRNPFEVAPALIERQLDIMVERVRIQLAMAGMDPRRGFDEAKAKEDMRAEAKDEVRAAFLIDALSEAEGIKVSDAELDKRLAEMAVRRNQSLAKLRAELLQQNRIDSVRRGLRDEKTLDLLLTQAKISDE